MTIAVAVTTRMQRTSFERWPMVRSQSSVWTMPGKTTIAARPLWTTRHDG